MSSELLPDETWARLDHTAGRLPVRARRRVAAGVMAAIVFLIATFVLRQSGLARPHLYARDTLRAAADPVQHTLVQTVILGNSGWRSVRVIGVQPPSAGLRVTSVDGVPVTIGGRSSATITVHYAVTDCAAIRTGETPVAYRVHQWWGDMAVTVTSPPWLHPTTDEIEGAVMAHGAAYTACHGTQ